MKKKLHTYILAAIALTAFAAGAIIACSGGGKDGDIDRFCDLIARRLNGDDISDAALNAAAPKRYLEIAKEAEVATPEEEAELMTESIKMLFADCADGIIPAYAARAERRLSAAERLERDIADAAAEVWGRR